MSCSCLPGPRRPQLAQHAEPPEPCKDPKVIAVSPSALSGFRLTPPAGAIQEDSLKPRVLPWSAPPQARWSRARPASRESRLADGVLNLQALTLWVPCPGSRCTLRRLPLSMINFCRSALAYERTVRHSHMNVHFDIRQLTDVSVCNLQQHLPCNWLSSRSVSRARRCPRYFVLPAGAGGRRGA